MAGDPERGLAAAADDPGDLVDGGHRRAAEVGTIPIEEHEIGARRRGLSDRLLRRRRLGDRTSGQLAHRGGEAVLAVGDVLGLDIFFLLLGPAIVIDLRGAGGTRHARERVGVAEVLHQVGPRGDQLAHVLRSDVAGRRIDGVHLLSLRRQHGPVVEALGITEVGLVVFPLAERRISLVQRALERGALIRSRLGEFRIVAFVERFGLDDVAGRECRDAAGQKCRTNDVSHKNVSSC